MKKVFSIGRYASIFAAVLLASSAMVSCEEDPKPNGPTEAPEAAGTIQGPTELADGASINLEIGKIGYATEYKWYKDGEAIQTSVSRVLTVTAVGTYAVAGVNQKGEGDISDDHVVVRLPVPPSAAGTIAGPTEVEEGSSIELSIGLIDNAVTYKWYKDDVMVQNTDSRTLTVTAGGTYKVAGVNNDGEGTASPNHIVTLITATAPPAAAGTITGPNKVADGGTIELSIAEIARAETYKWYKDGVETQNTASRTLTVAAPGTYKVAGVNANGEGAASADHVVTLDDGSLLFTDIPEGTIAGTGTPGFLQNPGPSSWSTYITPIAETYEGTTYYYYEIAKWPAGNSNEIGVYFDYNPDQTLTIDDYSKLASGNHPDYGTIDGYFAGIYISGQYFYLIEDPLEIKYNKATRTLDFGLTYQGFEVLLGVPAFATIDGERVPVSFFTEMYPDAKLVITPTGGAAPAKTNFSRIHMNYNFATGLYELPSNIKFGGVVKDGKLIRK